MSVFGSPAPALESVPTGVDRPASGPIGDPSWTRGRSQLDTRLLEMFVLLAVHKHYGKAARAAGMAQPALSQSISQLERLTGCQLFDRTTRSVELTEPGKLLLPAARKLLVELTALRNSTGRFERARSRRVLMGLPLHFGTAAAQSVLGRFSSAPHFEHQIETVFRPAAELAVGLHEGSIDLALMYEAGPVDGLEFSAPAAIEARGVVLAETHPLAGRATLTTRDLVGESVLDLARSAFGAERVLWMPDLPLPRVADAVTNIEELYDSLVLERGVCLAPLSDADRFRSIGLAQVPVMDLEPVALSFVWSTRDDPPVSEALLRHAGSWSPGAASVSPAATTASPRSHSGVNRVSSPPVLSEIG